MARTTTTAVLLAGTELERRRDVTVLHTYTNGDRLVEAPPEVVAAIPSARRLPRPRDIARTEGGAGGLGSIREDVETAAVVQLAGPAEQSVVDLLHGTGVTLLGFEPPAGYRIRGNAAALTAASTLPIVRDLAIPTSTDKPRPLMPESGRRDLWIVLHTGDAEQTVDSLRSIEGVELVDHLEPPAGPYRQVAAVADSGAVDAALALPGVASVEDRQPILLEDEVADLIVAGMLDSRRRPVGNYLRWLEDLGADGTGVTIGIVDSGVDESHASFTGRIVADDASTESWHGTFVAGLAAGDSRDERDPHGFLYGVGVAPAADLISQALGRPAPELCRRTVSTAGSSGGARGSVQNNSWGAGTSPAGMDYGSRESTYDAIVRDADGSGTPLTVCFSAGNEGADGLTRPKSAKNVIVTGNSESYRPEFRTDKPAQAGEADNPDEMFTGSGASSHGNCLDGRIRPHLCAPGEWTSGPNFSSAPGSYRYLSAQMTWGAGTSAASPKTAGACALASDWWSTNVSEDPVSPAMLRAMLVNGATDMGFGGPIPNERQGWGRLDLGRVFDESVHKIYVDQTILLTTVGDHRRWDLVVSDPTKPVKVTLAWTDPPGAVGSGTAAQPAIVNRLRLQVDHDGDTYYANDFTHGWSRAGSPPDDEGTDNTANVYLPGGTVTGNLTVTVTALHLALNCLTNQASEPQQDFALVIHNAHQNTGITPVDTTVILDDASTARGDDDHWADDGAHDGDDRWGDGTTRPTLRRGDEGSDVRDLQQALTSLGYDTNGIDGKYGSGTQSAVRQFQRDQGLTADGIAGTSTWTALDNASNTGGSTPVPDPIEPGTDPAGRPTLRRGDEGSDVRDLQQALTSLGYDTNGIDGKYGSGTQSAVRQFQRDQGLTADGIAGTSTWTALDNASNSGGSSDDGWDDWPDWDDWSESPGTEGTDTAPPSIPAVADELAAALALEQHTAPTPEGAADSVRGTFREQLAALARAWATPTDVDGVVIARSAIVVVGRGSRFTRDDVTALRHLGRLGAVYLLSDDQQVLGWLAQQLHVGRGVHYRLTTGPEGNIGAARAVVAEAHGRHRVVTPVRSNDDQTAVAARLDLTENDTRAIVIVRSATEGLTVTTPDGTTNTVTSRSRRKGIRLQTVDEHTQRLTLDADDRPLGGTWIIEAGRGDGALPTFDVTVAGMPPAVLTVDDGSIAPVATTESSTRPVTVSATSGSLLRAHIRAVSATESGGARVDLRPAERSVRPVGDIPTVESHGPDDGPEPAAPVIGGVLPRDAVTEVVPVVVESQGISPAGHRFRRTQHEDVVSVRSRSEQRRARGRRRDAMDLVRGEVRGVEYTEEGAIAALLVRAPAGDRVLRVDEPRLRNVLRGLTQTRQVLLFGVDGDRVQSVVQPFRTAS